MRNFALNTKALFRGAVYVVLSMAILLVWLFIGVVNSYLDEETQTTFFIKRFPTFQVRFFDPGASEADYEHMNELSEEERQAVIDYCKYRFAVTSSRVEDIEACRKRIPSYLGSSQD